VLKLATDLRANGVDAILDQWDLVLGQDVVAFMSDGISKSDRVLLVCTDLYISKAEGGSGGVGYERLIVTAELVQNIDTRKFIPVARNNAGEKRMPVFLGPRLYVDFGGDEKYAESLDHLLRELLGTPRSSKPPLGSNPFSGVAQSSDTSAQIVGPTGRTPSGAPILDEDWFATQQQAAEAGIKAISLQGHMELRFALHDVIAKSQIELLNAVRSSEIRTFGWPIGITLENREEYRPRPYQDGVRAEIAIGDQSKGGRPSYDYWAVRSSGEFYLLQSLFEDQRSSERLFFNTRLVRIAESLMFGARLYNTLGVQPDVRVSARITHRGLRGRTLTASSLNRDVSPAESQEDQSSVEIVLPLGEINDALVDNVKRIAAPMFMLFEFTEFADVVYQDIINRFVKGEVS
jgi:TIR domain-containing protein